MTGGSSTLAMRSAPGGRGGGGVLGGPADRLDDVRVAGAAADLARDRLADRGVRRVRVLVEQRARGEHHARRAEAALEPVLFHEPLLHGVERAVLLEPL